MSGRQVIELERKNDEQMIYLKDLIFAALYRWRAVLAVALILALVLGGYKAVTGLKAGKQVTQEAQTQYQQELAAKEQQVTQLENTMRSQQKYLESSVLMKLDPYGYYEATVKLYVLTDYQILPGMSYQNRDKTDSVLIAYQTALEGDAALQAYAQVLGVESQYVAELMKVEPDDQADTLLIRIKCRTSQEADALLEQMKKQLSAAQEKISADMEKHSLQLLQQDVLFQIDPALIDTQKKENARITDLNKSLTEARTALAGVKHPGTQSTGAIVKSAVIFAVVGAVLGVFFGACAIFVAHIAGGKVYSCRALRGRTGVKVIGAVESAPRKNPIDRLLRKWEGRNAGTEQLAALATDISCRAEGVERLLITGSAEQEDRKALVTAIAQAMPGVQVKDPGALTQAKGLAALKNCDAVVLVVKCGKSRYEEVAQQMELIADYSKQLLGCVVLDG